MPPKWVSTNWEVTKVERQVLPTPSAPSMEVSLSSPTSPVVTAPRRTGTPKLSGTKLAIAAATHECRCRLPSLAPSGRSSRRGSQTHRQAATIQSSAERSKASGHRNEPKGGARWEMDGVMGANQAPWDARLGPGDQWHLQKLQQRQSRTGSADGGTELLVVSSRLCHWMLRGC